MPFAPLPSPPLLAAGNRFSVAESRLPPWYPTADEPVSHAKMTGTAPAVREKAKSFPSPVASARLTTKRVAPAPLADADTSVTSCEPSGVGAR